MSKGPRNLQDYGSEGLGFESLRARHRYNILFMKFTNSYQISKFEVQIMIYDTLICRLKQLVTFIVEENDIGN